MMVQELLKCSNDPEYFLLNYGYVRNPAYGYIRFRLYEYQKECLKAFQDHRFNITLKSRQTGLSTVSAGYIAWLMIFHSGKEIAVIANNQKTAQSFIRKVKLLIKRCPPWMVPSIESDNKKSIELKNGSKVGAESTTTNAAIGESLDLLVIDEAASIDSNMVKDLWGTAYPTLSTGGGAIIISTPKGVGNFYHQQWVRAKSGESKFNPLYIHWTQHPDYGKDTTYVCKSCKHEYGAEEPENMCEFCGKKQVFATSPWYREQCVELNDERLESQELDCSFLGSGDNVIEDEYIDEVEKETSPPMDTGGYNNGIWYWKEPEEGHNYIIGADVARGDGTDFSACHVIDIDTLEQVAEFKGKIPPDTYAKLLCELGSEYNNAILATEANSIGYATCLKIVELEYPNIFYSKSSQFKTRDRKKIERSMRDTDNMIPGFQTTSANRPLLISQLEQSVRNNLVKINSMRTVAEFRTLIWHNGKPEAMSGTNDDLSISLGMTLLIINTTIKDIMASKELIKASLASIKNSFGVSATESATNKGFARSHGNSNPWVMTNRSGDQEDLTWLVSRKGKK